MIKYKFVYVCFFHLFILILLLIIPEHYFTVIVRFHLLKLDLLFREFFQYPSHRCRIVLWYLCDGTILIK